MVTQELINFLKEYYPNKIPMGDINGNQLSFLQGQQSVIQRLEQILEEDNGRSTGIDSINA
jgi:hypothetical protein